MAGVCGAVSPASMCAKMRCQTHLREAVHEKVYQEFVCCHELMRHRTRELSTFSKRLAAAGVKSCLSRIEELGKGVMGGVSSYFPASNWNVDAPDKHLASVLLGQKYNNPKLPLGFAVLFGAPNGSDGCDGASVQVLPSPIDCPTLQQDILKRGKLIGDLAGVPFIQDVS